MSSPSILLSPSLKQSDWLYYEENDWKVASNWHQKIFLLGKDLLFYGSISHQTTQKIEEIFQSFSRSPLPTSILEAEKRFGFFFALQKEIQKKDIFFFSGWLSPTSSLQSIFQKENNWLERKADRIFQKIIDPWVLLARSCKIEIALPSYFSFKKVEEEVSNCNLTSKKLEKIFSFAREHLHISSSERFPFFLHSNSNWVIQRSDRTVKDISDPALYKGEELASNQRIVATVPQLTFRLMGRKLSKENIASLAMLLQKIPVERKKLVQIEIPSASDQTVWELFHSVVRLSDHFFSELRIPFSSKEHGIQVKTERRFCSALRFAESEFLLPRYFGHHQLAKKIATHKSIIENPEKVPFGMARFNTLFSGKNPHHLSLITVSSIEHKEETSFFITLEHDGKYHVIPLVEQSQVEKAFEALQRKDLPAEEFLQGLSLFYSKNEAKREVQEKALSFLVEQYLLFLQDKKSTYSGIQLLFCSPFIHTHFPFFARQFTPDLAKVFAFLEKHEFKEMRVRHLISFMKKLSRLSLEDREVDGSFFRHSEEDISFRIFFNLMRYGEKTAPQM